MEKVELIGSNNPLPRFGHTVTYISKGKAILFGGATGDTGRYSITGDTFSFDQVSKYWRKIEATGNSPSPRAAHASVAVEMNQLVVYGGASGGGSLASDDLYLLDLRSSDESGIWTIVPVIGTTPGRRYGHTLTYSRPYLVVFGGNTGGQEPVNDCWVLNVEKSPFSWLKLECKNDSPNIRVYHSASLCQIGSANGMIVIFGGRSGDGQALNDTWGLRRHRDGRWDWVKAPYKNDKEQPLGRYQHSSLFLGSAMIVIGGRTNNVGENVGLDIYDTETSEWTKFPSVQRFRHASWLVESSLYIYGGFEQDQPNVPTDQLTRVNLVKFFTGNDNLMQKVMKNASNTPPHYKQQAINSQNQGTPNMSPNTSQDKISPNNSLLGGISQGAMAGVSGKFSTEQLKGSGINQQQNNNSNKGKDKNNFILSNKAVVVEENRFGDNQNNSKVLTYSIDDPNRKSVVNKYGGNQTPYDNMLHNQFINMLLKPKDYINLPDNSKFYFKSEHILALCDQAQAVLETQPMVLKVRAPIKIYGDIHGQYSDLMRFFDLWGSPCDGGKDGDIESFDYLFLGDFVDRGSHSLETICLLMALKIKYPDQVHLIRGNHEDKWINNGFGFSEECASRLQEDPNDEDSVFNRVNRFFDWLPLCAVIEEKVICLHGGIGSSLNYVEEIDQLQRPLEVIHEVSTLEQQLVVDILWSDPTDSDVELGIHPNTIRDPGGTGNIVKFGPDRVQHFLKNNNLSLIIRAHECVMDGFERFAGGQLITVFSATDYCGKHKNAGAVLILKKNFEIIPKLIYPSNGSTNNWLEDEDSLRKRPPTPPRWKNALPRKTSYD